MVKPTALIGQTLLYALFAGIIGFFATSPPYRHLEPDQALIKLSFSHHGKPISACRQRTPEELAKLPPNMRAPLECPRERSPVSVNIELDGAPLYSDTINPSGLRKDGASTVYRRFVVPAGEHALAVRIRDSVQPGSVEIARAGTVQLKPAQVLVIDLSNESEVVFQ